MKPSTLASFSILTALSISTATAATVLVDLGITTQSTAGNWNNFGAASPGSAAVIPILADLVDSSGATTGITMTHLNGTTANQGTSGGGANYAGSYPATISSQPMSALQDGLFGNGNNSSSPLEFTLSGLDPNLTFDFTLYGARGNNGGDSIYTLTGANSGNGTISSVLNNSSEVVVISGISPTAGGEITFSLTSGNLAAGAGSINFMQVDYIPEPSTALLGGIGLLALLRRRR